MFNKFWFSQNLPYDFDIHKIYDTILIYIKFTINFKFLEYLLKIFNLETTYDNVYIWRKFAINSK